MDGKVTVRNITRGEHAELADASNVALVELRGKSPLGVDRGKCGLADERRILANRISTDVELLQLPQLALLVRKPLQQIEAHVEYRKLFQTDQHVLVDLLDFVVRYVQDLQLHGLKSK